MACNSKALSGIQGHCSSAMGGIKRVLIIEKDDIKSVKLNDTGDKIGTITLESGKSFKEFTFRKQSSNFSSEATIDDTTGAKYITTTLEMVFTKMETVKRIEMMALLMDDCVCIVEDQQGAYWYLGKDNGVTASALTAQSGTAYGDQNGYTIQMQDMSEELPFEVDEVVIKGDDKDPHEVNPLPID